MTCARPQYGVVSHSDGYPLAEIPERAVYVSDVLKAQASLQRIRWPVIEAVEGVQDFTIYDEIFEEFNEHDIPIVWLITGTPSWVNGSTDQYIVPATHLQEAPLAPILNVNPFFEENLDGWIAVGGTATRSDEQAHEGSWSVKLVSDGTQEFAKVRPDDFSVSDIRAGDTFNASGWIFSEDGHTSAGISMDWYDKNGTFIKTTSNNTSIASGAWTFFENVYTAPYRARHAIIWLSMGDNPASGETFFGDEIILRRAPAQASQQEPNFQTFLEAWRDFARTLGERYPGSKWLLWDRPNNPRFWKPQRPSSTFVLGYKHYTVPWIKQALTALGFTTANFTDVVDTSMIAKLAEYQASVGLPADGIMDSETWDNLRCDFETTIDEPPKRSLSSSPLETLRLGDTGGVVAWVQRQLIKFGFWTSPQATVTGIWNEVTTRSWKKFERTANLRFSRPDGIAGPESFAAMIRLWRRKTPYVPKKPKFESGGPTIDTTITRQTYQSWYENVRENIKIGDPTAEVCLATIEGMNVAPAPLEGTSGINGAAFLTELYDNASSTVTIENFAVFPLSPDSGTYNDLIAEDNPFAWWRLEPGTGSGSTILYGFHADLHFFNGDDDRLAVQSDAHCKVQRSTLLWRKVQTTMNTFDWSGADAMVDNAEARGIRSNLNIWKFPEWANGDTDDTVVPAFPSAAFDTFKDRFATFCGLAAARYIGKDILWEIGNEPNERFFYKDAATGLPNRPGYSELFEAARTAIRAEDPTAKVAIGGLTSITAGIDITGLDFLEGMLDTDGVTLGADDAVAVHAYTSGHGPDEFVEFERNFLDYWYIRDALDTRSFTTIPMWLNEWGWQNAPTDFVQTALEFIRDKTKTTDGFTWPGSATDHLIEVVCYFFDIDTPDFPGWGMYDTSFERKAIATTFSNFVTTEGQIDPGGDFSGNGHDGEAVGGVSQGVAAPIGAEGLGFGWQFDGNTGHFRDGTVGTYGSSIDDGFTVELWMSSTENEPTGEGGLTIPPPRESIVTIEDFIDDFEDEITDTDLWDHSSHLFIEANGYLTVPQTGGTFRVVGSTKIMQFQDGQNVFWEWEFPKPPEFGGEQFFRITPGAAHPIGTGGGPPDDIKMGRVSSNLNITINHNGDHFLFEQIPWDDDAHRHCRMRLVSGQMHFETSSDGQTWVNPFPGSTGISDVPFDITNVTIAFINGFFSGNGAGDMRIHGINVPDIVPAADFGNAVFGVQNSGDSTALLMSLHRDKSNVPVQGRHRVLIQDSDGTSRAFHFEAEITDGELHHIALQADPLTNAVRVLVDGIDTFADRITSGTFNVTTNFDQDFVIAGVNNAGTVEAFTACTVYDFVLYDYNVSADRLDLHFEARGRAQDDPPTGPVDTRAGRNNFRDIARAREIVKSFNRADHMWTVFGWPDTLTQAVQADFLTRAFEIIEGNRFESYRGPLGQPVELRETQFLDVEYVFWFRGQDTDPENPPTPPPSDPISYEDAVLADDPFLFYRLNETSGTDALDSSGNNYHGFYRNNPDLGQPAFNAELGTSVDFNDGFALDEWVDVASSAFKQFGSKFQDGYTVECWVKTTSTTGIMTILGCFNDGFNTAFQLSLNTSLDGNGRLNTHRMFVRDNDSDSASFEFFSSTLRDGNWHHLVVAGRPKNINDKFIWIDGTPVSISAKHNDNFNGPTSSFQYTLNIASSQDRSNINDHFIGSLDEVALYTYVLSESRVDAHFQAAQGTGETEDPPPPPESFDDRMSGTYGLAQEDYPTVTKTLKLAGDAFVRWIIGRFLQTPFLPPLVRPDPREGRYRIESRDRWTLEPVAVLPHVNIQGEFLLNRPGSLRFDMPLRHSKTTTDNIDPVRHEVWMYRDGQLIYAGPVWSVRADSSENKLSVVSRSLESYLETRHLGHGLPSDSAFTEQPQELIAWRWIEYTQRWPFGTWCFVRGTHTGVSVNRTIIYAQQEYQEILEAIEDISELSRGFDWEINVNREFNTWFPRIATDPIVIEFGANMSSYNVPLIGTTIANYVVIQGRDQDEDTPEFIAEDFVSQRQFGRMEYVETMGEVQEAEDFPLLEARARFYLSENKSFRTMPSVVMRSHPLLGRVTELDDQRLHPGATIRVRINDGYIDLNQTVRTTGYQLTVSSNDSEAVVVFIDVETGDQ